MNHGRIILNADDYALSPGVSQAIRMLAAGERISSTSAIVTRPGWKSEAAALKPLRARIATGLHLNLTLGAPLGGADHLTRNGTLPRVTALIAAAYAGRLNIAAVRAEISRQLDAFEAGTCTPPDFIDGHEHVHVLPVIRPALLEILQGRYAGKRLLVRDPSPAVVAPRLKSLALRFFARNMRRDVEQAGFICNDAFGGVTRFGATIDAVTRDFTAAAEIDGWRPLVMCHPGFTDPELVRLDPHTTRRQSEFDVLMAANSPLALNAWRPHRLDDGSVAWPYSNGERAP